MRSTITFDTLEYSEELKKSGMEPETAEALTKATARAFNQMMETKDLTTTHDLIELEKRLQLFIIKSLTALLSIAISVQTILHFIQ